MRLYFLLVVCLCLASSLTAQKDIRFSLSVSSDSILFGNYFELTYTLENAEMANFNPPDFDGFEVVGGPNTSSSMSMINGDVTRSTSYSYYLRPIEEGNYMLPVASVETEEGTLESEALSIQVVPNPDGIIQRPKREQHDLFFDTNPFDHPFFRSPFEEQPVPETKPAPKKKKRKITKV